MHLLLHIFHFTHLFQPLIFSCIIYLPFPLSHTYLWISLYWKNVFADNISLSPIISIIYALFTHLLDPDPFLHPSVSTLPTFCIISLYINKYSLISKPFDHSHLSSQSLHFILCYILQWYLNYCCLCKLIMESLFSLSCFHTKAYTTLSYSA